LPGFIHLRILFIIRSLELGGAQRQLALLARGLAARGHTVTVIAFYPGGLFERELTTSTVRLVYLHKRSRWSVAGFIFKLRREIKLFKPEVVYGFLGVPNLIVAMLPLIGCVGITRVAGFRASAPDASKYDWAHALVIRCEPLLVPLVDLAIANSWAMANSLQRTFGRARIAVVPNGIDLTRFQFDGVVRSRLRMEWSLDKDAVAVGLVARLDPMKDHETFLLAASKLISMGHGKVYFFCVGDGDASYLDGLKRIAGNLGLHERVRWLPGRSDIQDVYSALDILCLSSAYGEGFPNVVAEGMACGLPCVVTDIGDSGAIVADRGWVVAPKDAETMAAALASAIAALRPEDRELRRRSIAERFSVEALINATEAAIADAREEMNISTATRPK
jgi:glycosyltransferase involved in cell wall biosynthesis